MHEDELELPFWEAVEPRVVLTPSSATFLRGARRVSFYAWRKGRCVAQRLPSGGWCWYSFGGYLALRGSRITPAGFADNGNIFHRALLNPISGRHFVNYLLDGNRTRLEREGWEGAHTALVATAVRTEQRAYTTLLAWTLPELIEAFGLVPVTRSDSYAAGNCRAGTDVWFRAASREAAPTLQYILGGWGRDPMAKQAACMAVAYAWGNRPLGLLPEGLSEEEILDAVESGEKDGGFPHA